MPLAKSRSSSDMTKPEQKVCKSGKEGDDPFDNIIRQTIGKEPFMSFSRAGENHVQWIQLLHALDQQGTNKLSKGSKAVNGVDGKDWIQEPCNGVSLLSSEMNGFKDSIHSQATGAPVKAAKIPSEHIHHHKIPEIVAFAAAKANGESEKYFPGWPLSLLSKLQMQKCEKCSREFCSTINYRRHIRLHRRSLNIDKDSSKNRDYLSTFWDKLSLEGATEIVSFKDVLLEEVPGSSIIKALIGFVRKPGFTSVPQSYMKAGSALLDIIQARPSRLPISSKELFAMLDDASEKTFLCAGTAVSLRRFVFDGEAAKIGVEPRNIVACTSFLIEQRLVTAWLADKDAEALRCQKLLVEEEEAAQKRQAELVEKRRQKKLRHREQRVKDQAEEDMANVKDVLLDLANDSSSLIETPSLAVPNIVDHEGAESTCNSTSPDDSAILTDAEGDKNGATGGHLTGSGETGTICFHDLIGATTLSISSDGDNDRANDGDITGSVETDTSHFNDPASEDPSDFHGTDHKAPYVSGKRYPNMARRQAIRQPRYVPNVLTSGPENGPVSKTVNIQKHGGFKDQRVTSQTNGHKVWTTKLKVEDDRDDIDKEGKRGEVHDLQEQKKDCEVLIGSISIALSGSNVARQYRDDVTVEAEPQSQNCIDTNQLGPQPTGNQPATKSSSLSDKRGKSDSGQTHVGHSKVKLWRPVGMISSCRNGGGSTMEQTSGSSCDSRDTGCGGVADKMTESCTTIENCCRQLDTEEDSFHSGDNSDVVEETDAVNQTDLMLFSTHAAQIFLNERWKEAISGDHVTVVNSPEMDVSLPSVNTQSTAESSPSTDRGNNHHKPCHEGFEHSGLNSLASTENRLASADLRNSTNGASISRPRSNFLKSSKLKYIPKQRNGIHQ